MTVSAITTSNTLTKPELQEIAERIRGRYRRAPNSIRTANW